MGAHMNQKTTCPHCRHPFEVPGESFDTVLPCPACGGKFSPMKEYIKASWELTKTPEFQSSLKEHIAESNKNITHADFVVGVQNKTMGFKCVSGEPSQLVRGGRKTMFNGLCMLYMIAPLVLVPFWAYHESNWWLLIGIVVASLVSPQLAQRKGHSIGGFFLLAIVFFWYMGGIHSYYTFFSVCALWGYMFSQMAEEAQREYAMQSLIENSDLFDRAIAQGRIMIVRRE